MERSVIRDGPPTSKIDPDCAALHPGYASTEQSPLVMRGLDPRIHPASQKYFSN
jgi:hypothetical protein